MLAVLLSSWAGQMQASSKLEAIQFHNGVVPKPPAGHKWIGAQQHTSIAKWFLD